MLAKTLHRYLFPDVAPRSHIWFWFILSLIFAVLFASLELVTAFSSDYVVQDDARQHVFWMRRFLDPGLFPNDLIADYFQSSAPAGYAGFYRLMAMIGIDPMVMNKWVPMLLAVIASGFCFGVVMQLLPIPVAGFAASILLNENFWLQDDLVSGTARAFLYPIFLAFLFFLLRRSLIPCLITIVVQGLFYPQFVLVIALMLVLQLVEWRGGPRLTRDRQKYWFCIAGLVTSFVVLLPYALEQSPYGEVVSVEQAKTMPEFLEGGRAEFFIPDAYKFWFSAKRSALLVKVMYLGTLSAIALPFIMRMPRRFPLVQRLQNMQILVQLVITGLALFVAAHVLLFKLYLPGRYPQNIWQMLTAIAGGIVLTLIADALLRRADEHPPARQWGALGLVGLLGLMLFISPYFYYFPRPSYETGSAGQIYRYLANQPPDTLVASIAPETDNIPSFAQRSVLVSREYSLPYHQGYYAQMRQRALDVINANYSPDLQTVKSAIQTYGVDYWLVDREFLTQTESDYDRSHSSITYWLKQFEPDIGQIRQRLQQGETPAIASVLDQCGVKKTKILVLLEAQCILNTPS